MRRAEDGRARGFVAPAGFDTDEAVFDDIDPSDAVFPRERVELEKDVDIIGVGLAALVVGSGGDGELDRETGLELDGDAVGLRGCVFDGLGEFPHVCGRGGVGVFEYAGFVGDVEEVFICGPGFGGGLLDRYVFFGSIFEEGLTTGEAVVKL